MVAWTEIFRTDVSEVESLREGKKCCRECWEAKELKCVCRCNGANHGRAWKKDNERLDRFEGEGETV
jgi:hypothetical protein